ncbi:MAG: hypothetical protein U0V75_18825 [Ferruginibacter sp.]
MLTLLKKIFFAVICTMGLWQGNAQTVSLNGEWLFRMGDDPSWKNASAAAPGWQKVTVPAGWNRLGLNKEKTVAWYLLHFAVPEKLLGQDLVLFAGTIDDADETYFNGVLVGKTGRFPPGDESAWDTERKYTIGKTLVKKENTIAIRVYNGIGDGGIYGGNVMLLTKAMYEKQVAAQLKNKKSYYQLTTSNGLVAAVYNEQTASIENFYPHIFSYYDSGLAVKPILSNLHPVTDAPVLYTKYKDNTHVIETGYPEFTITYYTSFTKKTKALYVQVKGRKTAVENISFKYDPVSGNTEERTVTKKEDQSACKYFVFAFSDTLNALPDMDALLAGMPSPAEELRFMKTIFAQCKYPGGITAAEKNVFEQGISILKMSQVGEGEVFPLAKGQVLASLRPGVWAICWVRDGAFAIEAMSKLGMYGEAKNALEFMLRAKPTNQFIHYIHTDGKDYGTGVPYIISLTRYFGNGREECDYTTDGGPNIELDDLGLFLTAAYHYVNESGDMDFLKRWDNELRTVGNAIIHNISAKGILRRDSGPWEHHLPGKEFMWASGTCARGLQLVSQLQKKAGADYAVFENGSRQLYNGILKNCLIDGRYIKGNATEQDPADHHYYDAATFELFAGGLVSDKKLFASHMAEYNKHNRAAGDPQKGYIRFNSSDSYENQEWPFAGLRVAVAQKKLGSPVIAKQLISRITSYAARNNNQVPEILSNDLGLYKGAIPMVGYGSAAYILALMAFYKN